MVRASLLSGLLVATLVLPGPSSAATRLLLLDRDVAARVAPHPGARVVGVVPAETPLTRSQMALPVIGRTKHWLHVRLPMRPDGATGWVPASAGATGAARWQIVVHRDARRAVVLENGRARATFPVVVGRPSTPTPLGTFFVVEKIRIAPGVAEGPWALATSAYSYVLQRFAGGDGQVGLHGTVGLGGTLGTAASHGCIRFAPAAISWIAGRVDPGTPVVVTR